MKTLDRLAGRWRNHVSLWVTLLALPVLWHVRLMEIVLYPVLVWTLDFPHYRSAEWVNVSRHKFKGLVGHDLFWCLYGDWAAGVASLGVEMLRNAQSFWCPIRFADARKCEHCKHDFPDLNQGWIPADGTMANVTARLEQTYAAGNRSWFGHRSRPPARGRPN